MQFTRVKWDNTDWYGYAYLNLVKVDKKKGKESPVKKEPGSRPPAQSASDPEDEYPDPDDEFRRVAIVNSKLGIDKVGIGLQDEKEDTTTKETPPPLQRSAFRAFLRGGVVLFVRH